MDTPRNRDRRVVGRLALTIAIGCGASTAIVLVSNAVKAIEGVDRTNNALAELSHYVAVGHASIHERVTARDSSVSDAVARLNLGVERRMTRLGPLSAVVEERTAAHWWTQWMQGDLDVRRIDAERRVYVLAATRAATAPASGLATSVRLLDLQAQKLIQTVETVRDSADTVRAQALSGIDAIVTLSLGTAGLLIAYLIWLPFSKDARHQTTASLTSDVLHPRRGAVFRHHADGPALQLAR